MRQVACLLLTLLLASRSGGGDVPTSAIPPGADLTGFQSTIVMIDGVEFDVWLARTPTERQQGLRNATPAQLAPDDEGRPRGMLFVFDRPGCPKFLMRDTYVPLDLAYARADWTIVEIHVLVPRTVTPVEPSEEVRFALEVPRGTLATNGVGIGDVIQIPQRPFD